MDHVPELLAGWESYYVIIGSSAAALTGLQFVIMTLIADSPMRRSSDSIAAFGTPTVVHFCLALLVSAVLSAPWPEAAMTRIPLGATGVGGVIYTVLVMRRAHRQTSYQPVFEDWLFHVLLPFGSYALLCGGAVAFASQPVGALFAVAGSTLLLIFIGIHNAWDTIQFITLRGTDTSGGE
jgi:hypothetical protein